MQFLRSLALVAVALFGAVAAPAQDELGLGKMWTFERPPAAWLQREYGFVPDAAFFARLQAASLRFGKGGSASFVSARGLVLTNHHCVREFLPKTPEALEWGIDGFLAKEASDEVRLPGLEIKQLVRVGDVSVRIEAGVLPAADPAVQEAIRVTNREAVLAAARAADPELEPQVVKLYQGAVWRLYQYRVFDDVRLVMMPHQQIAMFGGDPDNFTYPRYAIDFAFCRAWDGDKPLDTTDCHLVWGDGPTAGEVVFVTGNPAGTQRQLTMAQLDFLRDVRYPRVRELIDARLAILRDFARDDAAAEKRLRSSILWMENGQKLFRGEHQALLDPAFVARKRAAETMFKERAAKAGHAPDLRVWDDIADVAKECRQSEAAYYFHNAGWLPLLMRALDIVEFARTGDAAIAARARASECSVDPVQQALFADHLRRARRHLPADDPYVRAMLGGREPEAAAAELLAGTRLCDAAETERLLAGGKAAVEASTDSAIVAARKIAPLMDAAKATQAAIEAKETALGTRLAKLLFAVYGEEVPPDATGTLRWSDGRVLGYECNGTRAPWRTVFQGMFARSAEFDGLPPYDLPREWLLAKDRIDLQAAVDFVCTVDSAGGNSGSPVVNRKGEFTGLLFDGNIESLANRFLYGERVERSVCVHPQAIVEALRKVYGANRILRELAR
ncbi:MAG: S46 family peptidase [Planctomycetes bacterium]|nr:S46 family peptidase [Planctomycetota bacterium]